MTQIDTAAIEAITSLQQPGKPDLFGKVFDLFEQNSPALLDTIESGCAAGDTEAVRGAAHSLKSSAAYVGATEVSELSKTIERAAREDQLSDVSAEVGKIRESYETSVIALKNYLQNAA